MTWPTVTVSQKNRYNGTTDDIERVVLFVGYGDTNTGKTQPLNTGTDLDKALGDSDSLLKRIVAAAASNAGQNWFAYVHVLPEPDVDAEDYEPDADWIAHRTGLKPEHHGIGETGQSLAGCVLVGNVNKRMGRKKQYHCSRESRQLCGKWRPAFCVCRGEH